MLVEESTRNCKNLSAEEEAGTEQGLGSHTQGPLIPEAKRSSQQPQLPPADPSGGRGAGGGPGWGSLTKWGTEGGREPGPGKV